MRPSLLFLVAHAGLILLGAAAAFHPAVARLGLAARLCAAFAAGAVLLTLEALVFSLAGLPWSVAALAVAPLGFAAYAWRKRDPAPDAGDLRSSSAAAVRALAGGALALAVLHVLVSFATSRSTSVDYLFFWGVKAVHFARARGIDVEFLKWPFFAAHGVPDYPPLLPVVQAWGVLLAGEMPWRRVGPLSSALWFLAAIPLVHALLRRRIGAGPAAAVTAFWGAALGASLSMSYSGGNAEAPLLFFETVAGVALITETRGGSAGARAIAAATLAGAVLTKVEGLAVAAFLVMGTLARDGLERRPRKLRRIAPVALAPAGAVGCWFLFQLLTGLRVGYRGHGALLGLHWEHLDRVAIEMFRNLGAGTAGLSWAFPAVLLVLFWRRIVPVLPAVAGSVGLLLFLAFDYLHDARDPWERIGWTLPRVSQAALSLLILAAGVAVFASPRARASVLPDSEPAAPGPPP